MARGITLGCACMAGGHVTIVRSERKLAQIVLEDGCYE